MDSPKVLQVLLDQDGGTPMYILTDFVNMKTKKQIATMIKESETGISTVTTTANNSES